MLRDWLLYLEDMQESVQRVLEYTKGLDQETFLNHSMAYDATLRNLEILGEVVKHIPDHVKNKHEHIDWRGIREFRNFVTHAYFKVDPDILWDVITNKVPELQEQLKNIG